MATPFSFGASANPNLGPAGSIAEDPAGAQPNIMQLLAQLLAGGQQQQAPGGGANLGALLKQVQGNKDPVGQFNNRSNLPSYAAGSTSPFNGFFKPMAQAFAQPGMAPTPAAPPMAAPPGVAPDMNKLLKKKSGGFSFGAGAGY
jgi:hypothetical protein